MYQHEHRLAAIPPDEATDSLTPFFVEIGNLEDIAELVTIDR